MYLSQEQYRKIVKTKIRKHNMEDGIIFIFCPKKFKKTVGQTKLVFTVLWKFHVVSVFW